VGDVNSHFLEKEMLFNKHVEKKWFNMFARIEIDEPHQVFTFIFKNPNLSLPNMFSSSILIVAEKMFLILCKCVLGHVKRPYTIDINGMKSKYLGFSHHFCMHVWQF